MSKLMRVETEEQRNVPGHDGATLSVRVVVIDSDDMLKHIYDRVSMISDRYNKASQIQMTRSVKQMVNEALREMFSDEPETPQA